MNKLIVTPIPATVSSNISMGTNNSIQELKPYHVGLTEKQRQGRSMAEGREGMVRLMSKISLQHTDSLARNDDPMEMVTLLKTYEEGGQALQAIKQLMEMMDDTLIAVGMDLMKLYDTYNKHLQADRSNNTALDAAMNEIDDYNKRFGSDSTDEGGDTPPTP